MDNNYNYNNDGGYDNKNSNMFGLINEGMGNSSNQPADLQYNRNADELFDFDSVSLPGDSLSTARAMGQGAMKNINQSTPPLYNLGSHSGGNCANHNDPGNVSWNSSIFGISNSNTDDTDNIVGINTGAVGIVGLDGTSNSSYRSDFSVSGLIGSSDSTTSGAGSSLSTSPLIPSRSMPIAAMNQQRALFDSGFSSNPSQNGAFQNFSANNYIANQYDNRMHYQQPQQMNVPNSMPGTSRQHYHSYQNQRYSRDSTSPIPIPPHHNDFVATTSHTSMNHYHPLPVNQQQLYYQQQSYQPAYQHAGGIGTKGSNGNFVRSQQPVMSHPATGTGGSNAQGRAINKMLLEILRERSIDPHKLDQAIETYVDRMDCVNLATLLFHTGKKRMLLNPNYIKRIAARFGNIKEELRSREASNALYGLKCMSSEVPEVRELVLSLANKLSSSSSEFVAQAVGNALYGLQMMTSDYEEVRLLLHVLSLKVASCKELLEAQNVGNALYGLRGMSSDWKEVRAVVAALTPKIATAREDLNGQALGNSLYGLQSMTCKETEIRLLLSVLATKVTHSWEDLKAQEVGNALYGLKRMTSDAAEVRILISALVQKIASSPEILDAQAIGNSFYGLQNMRSDNPEVLSLLSLMAAKVNMSCPELDGQAMGNSLYGLQGMSSDYQEVRAVVSALTTKIQGSCLDMNAQELGNALFGIQRMKSEHVEVRQLLSALTQKAISSKYELTSQEIGNAIFGLQGMSSNCLETRVLVRQMAFKIQQSHTILDPQSVSNSLYGLRRLSSESEDVKLLLHALVNKVEQFWKLLSAQHVTNSLFGLQCLSSSEKEVCALVRALFPKIMACRDEMSASQLAHSFFGLRYMSSNNEEIIQLVALLTEKFVQSKDTLWNLKLLSMAMTGLQGMDSSNDIVRPLLEAILVKAKALSPEHPISPIDIANCLFGMQRMQSSQPVVDSLMTIFVTLLESSSDIKLNWQECTNIMFALNNCSFENVSVRKLLSLLVDQSKLLLSQEINPVEMLSFYQVSVLTLHQMGLVTKDTMQKSDSRLTDSKTSADNDETFDDDEDGSLANLKKRLLRTLSVINAHVENNPSIGERKLSAAEFRMTQQLADVLLCSCTPKVDSLEPKFTAEVGPFKLLTNTFLHGFHALAVIKMADDIPPLYYTNAETNVRSQWAPILNIEIRGTSYGCPSKDRFYSLRQSYLKEVHDVSVITLPADSFRIDGHQGMKLHATSALASLFPPTAEDATNFESQLVEQKVTFEKQGTRYILLSEVLASICNASTEDVGLSTSCHHFPSGVSSFLPEYIDDNLDQLGAISDGDSKQSLGVSFKTWLGPLPLIEGPISYQLSSAADSQDTNIDAYSSRHQEVKQSRIITENNVPIPEPIKIIQMGGSETSSTVTTPMLKVSPLSTCRSDDVVEGHPSNLTEKSEVDDEIAALEAQLEVARLEARIKLLKTKKLQQQQQQL